MDEQAFIRNMDRFTISTTKLLLKLAELLEGIRLMPTESKNRYKGKILGIYQDLVEIEKMLKENQDKFSKDQVMIIGKAHGRIESLMILIGLNVK